MQTPARASLRGPFSEIKWVTCWCSATAKSGVCPARRPEFSTSILQNISQTEPPLTDELCSAQNHCLQRYTMTDRSSPGGAVCKVPLANTDLCPPGLDTYWPLAQHSSLLRNGSETGARQHKLGMPTPRPRHLHTYNTTEYKTRQNNISLITTPLYKAILTATITKQHVLVKLHR